MPSKSECACHNSRESLSMDDRDLLGHTTAIVSSWTAANRSNPEDLLSAIRVVHQTLHALASGQKTAVEAEPQRPAVPIRKSVTPDYIVCLEDGRKLKTLKRHLRTAYDMTPEQYRAKWGLPSDYPMVAPNYSANRAEMARKIGLGRKPNPVETPAAKAAAKRGRRKKAAA